MEVPWLKRVSINLIEHSSVKRYYIEGLREKGGKREGGGGRELRASFELHGSFIVQKSKLKEVGHHQKKKKKVGHIRGSAYGL
jgi:hypothetical protein